MVQRESEEARQRARASTLASLNPDASKFLLINAGGRQCRASLETLCREADSLLAELFSGQRALQRDTDGAVFLEVDPDAFELILRWLRVGSMLSAPSDLVEVVRVQAKQLGLARLLLELAGASPSSRKEGISLPADYNPAMHAAYTVSFNFTARTPQELSLRMGDSVRVWEDVGKGWFLGESNSKAGFFPKDFVTQSIKEQQL